MTELDGSFFRIDLPPGLLAYGNSRRAEIYRSPLVPEDHPALAYVRWYVRQRGLVLASDAEHQGEGSEKFHGGCISSLYLPPDIRASAYERTTRA